MKSDITILEEFLSEYSDRLEIVSIDLQTHEIKNPIPILKETFLSLMEEEIFEIIDISENKIVFRFNNSYEYEFIFKDFIFSDTLFDLF